MTVEVREFACWDGPEEAPLVRKWVPHADYERLRTALFKHACHCGRQGEDPGIHAPWCPYRVACLPEPQSAEHS